MAVDATGVESPPRADTLDSDGDWVLVGRQGRGGAGLGEDSLGFSFLYLPC